VVLIVGACGLVGLAVLAVVAALLLPALGNAKSKAQSIQCLNNLKQLGLAARLYSVDHDGRYPSTWLQMTNEIGSPRILACPADTAHPRATAWAGLGPSNFSYVLEGKGVTESQTNRLISQCPIHGHLLLADGRVIQTRSPRPPVPAAQR
jgi:type II secretory pathway pseudopilin PulG